jgi:signal transduction histidine kinase
MFISIKTYIENDLNVIEIADNGIGIKDEFKDHIFEMYFGTDKNKGSGLGLYIVKEAVDNLKGNIYVSSEYNVGSKFIVSLPNSYEV